MSVVREPGRSFEYSVPVVVVGAGACGFAAALAARDAQVEVLVLERDRHPRGSTSMSLGASCAAASGEQRRYGIEDSADAFIADVMEKTKGRADGKLTEVIAHESGPTIDWLTTRHAVPLELDFKWTGLGHSKPRLHMPPGRSGEELLALLGNAAERAGSQLMTEAHVTDLFADEQDRIIGVRIARPDGAIEELGVGALVLACCGFGANRAMIEQYIPEAAGARYFGHEGNKGDGILWGIELGAAVGDMSAYQGLGTLADPQQIIVPHPLLIDGGFLANLRGERFTNELANISGMSIPVLQQPDGLAWLVFDTRRLADCLTHSVELRELQEIGAVRQGADWPTLERLCAVPGGSFERSHEKIDEVRAADACDRFGRSFSGLEPLRAPYCALRVTGALFHTQGGLVVNQHAQVMRTDGSLFPNLFAGGGAAQSISGPGVHGYLPGAGLCMALTLGRLAGRSAARLALEAIIPAPLLAD